MTGGFSWFPRFEGELPDIFRSVGGVVGNQYATEFLTGAKHEQRQVPIVRQDGRPLNVIDKKRSRKLITYAHEEIQLHLESVRSLFGV